MAHTKGEGLHGSGAKASRLKWQKRLANVTTPEPDRGRKRWSEYAERRLRTRWRMLMLHGK